MASNRKSTDTIKVFLRVRPARNPSRNYQIERQGFDKTLIKFHLDREKHSDLINNQQEDYKFSFNGVFDRDATQQDVFDQVARGCVESTLEGFNSTIFAYGQTGSGKTFSITGGSDSYEQRGIIPRSLGMVFDEVAKRPDIEWTIRVSYLQIYQNVGQDLLNRGKDAKNLDDLPKVSVLEAEEEVVVRDLGQHKCDKVEDALNLLFIGDTNRMYCETPMNQTSSRSHCIFTINIERKAPGSAVVRRSKLHLVDLAGSERPKKTGVGGQLLREAAGINLSLMFLEQVITALAEQADGKREHIPYRNSLMTTILRDSLGGNCKTTMLATAHPQDEWMDESISTCRFAQRVAQVKLTARINEEVDPVLLVKRLKAENASLKEELALLRKGDQAGDRILGAEEVSRCREIVRQYIADPDPDAQLTGLEGDLARIFCCFRIFKELANPSAVKRLTAPAPASAPEPHTPPTASQRSPVTPADPGTAAAVHTLQLQLQQRDQELSLLLGIVQKYQTPKVTVQTQTGEPTSPGGYTYSSPPAVAPASRPQPRPTPSATMPSARRPDAPREEQLKMAAAEHKLAGDYNLEALNARGTELFKDTAKAFEEFRKSWRRFEQMERQKEEQRTRCEKAKSYAATINKYVVSINGLKSRIQQLRAERATHGWEEPDEEEKELFQRLDKEKSEYKKLAQQLGEEKVQFEYLQKKIHEASERLTRDFESWWALRRWQMGGVSLKDLAEGGGALPVPGGAAPGAPPGGTQSPNSQPAVSSQVLSFNQPPDARPSSAPRHPSNVPRIPAGAQTTPPAPAPPPAPPLLRGYQGQPLPPTQPYPPQQPQQSAGRGAAPDAEVQQELRRLFQARDKLLGRGDPRPPQ
eukprot:Hpha_TRINITY_DN14477_c0_g4::TRINITY_DN14477_c0_g4_i1::g.157555::m.157555/K10397/KIF6_9; kinesin family member 6/9